MTVDLWVNAGGLALIVLIVGWFWPSQRGYLGASVQRS